MSDVEFQIRESVSRLAPPTISLSHRIHAAPELAFAEYQASTWVGEAMAEHGFTVETGVADLPTALVAAKGSGDLVVGLVAEYDALPDVGHACGHNIIAAASVAAAQALAPVADQLSITVKLFGTPAEEDGGGKILMLDKGVFAGTHVAMMVHPGTFDAVSCKFLAVGDFEVTYIGKTAHASFAPFQGINAGDALTIAQVALGLLRQQLPPGDQIHGIVTRGGEAPNIIPARTEARYCLRSPSLESLQALRARVVNCLQAGALATGCECRIARRSPDYSDFRNDQLVVDIYQRHAEALGRRFPASEHARASLGSTDMANVSRVIPAIHPMIAIDCDGSVNHQPEFAEHCAGPSADRAILDAATAMALTIAELAGEPQNRAHIKRTAAELARTSTPSHTEVTDT